MDVSTVESTDIGRPPRNPGQSHIQSCGQLIAKGAERRIDVSGPYERTISLTACPCAPKQIDDILLPFRFHSFVSHPRILLRVNIAYLKIRATQVAILFILIPGKFRLRLIQPEDADSILIIILLNLVPYICTSARIRHIYDARISELTEPFSEL